MAKDIFLKIDDIAGESRDAAHKNEIEISRVSWGMVQSGSAHIGSGGGAGKVNVGDMVLTLDAEKSTPNLFVNCCTGKHFKEATLTIRKAGEKPLEYMKIKMKEVLISGMQMRVGDGEHPIIDLTLNFAEYTVEYIPQKADGSGDAAIEVGFNIAKNVRV